MRSTLNNENLSKMAILCVKSDLLQTLNLEDVINYAIIGDFYIVLYMSFLRIF